LGFRSTALRLLPKTALSRVTGWITSCPLPRGMRAWVYRRFAARYGAALEDVQGELADYRSLAAFFQRPLRDGARPIAAARLVWPCDGRIVTAGAVRDGEIPQVKGVDYPVAQLLGPHVDAAPFARGSQATVYLAPGDYHRVHAPFAARLVAVHRIRGTLYPVNPPTVRAVAGVFVRNARVVFELALDDGRPAAVVMVGALNVGDIHPSIEAGERLEVGAELGRFGFGSTTVVLCPGDADTTTASPGALTWPDVAPGTRVLMGQAASGPPGIPPSTQ